MSSLIPNSLSESMILSSFTRSSLSKLPMFFPHFMSGAFSFSCGGVGDCGERGVGGVNSGVRVGDGEGGEGGEGGGRGDDGDDGEAGAITLRTTENAEDSILTTLVDGGFPNVSDGGLGTIYICLFRSFIYSFRPPLLVYQHLTNRS